MRKPVFRVVRPGETQTDLLNYRPQSETLHLASIGTGLFWQRTIKALIRLHRLFCSFGVSIWHHFLMTWLKSVLWKYVPKAHWCNKRKMSCSTKKPTKWSVFPAIPQISLHIWPAWSESLLCAQWVAKYQSFLHAHSENFDQTGSSLDAQASLLVLSCTGSNASLPLKSTSKLHRTHF